jgi:hypothetical protein
VFPARQVLHLWAGVAPGVAVATPY